MSILLILTQGVLLFCGTQLFPPGGKLDAIRFVCYGLIILGGLLLTPQLKLKKPRGPDLIALGILIFAFTSCLYSINPKLTLFRSIANLLMYLAVFWALWISCQNSARAYSFVSALISVWILFYGANLLFLFFRPEDSFIIHEGEYLLDEYQRFTGITISPNAIGEFSAIILPLVLWNFRRVKSLLNLFLVVAVIFSFFYSFSRDAFICSVVGSSIYFYLSARPYRVFIIVCAIFSIVFMILYIELFRLFLPAGLIRVDNLMVLGGRLEAWQAALELIKMHPFRGYGFGIEQLIFPYFGYEFLIHSGTYIHNCFLGLALQLGWIAALAFYIPLVVFLIRSFVKISRLRSKFQPFMSALYACLVAGFLTSFFESWIYSAGTILAFPFFTFMMLLMRMFEFHKSSPIKIEVTDLENGGVPTPQLLVKAR